MPTTQPLCGVIAPIVTPFNDDMSVATELFVDNAKRLLAEGCVALAPFGTTGEALSLSIDERMELLEKLISAGIDPARLIPGTGLTNLPDTVRLTRHAVDAGCAGAMTLPPFYYKAVPDDGLYRYYAQLIEAVGSDALRIYLYHIPQVAGVGMPISLVRRLFADFPESIVGIKDSSGDWENTKALLAIDGLIVYPASEATLIEADALGATGCISATANLNAGAIAEIFRELAAGHGEKAAAMHAPVKALRQTMQGYSLIAAQKRVIAMQTGEKRWANTRAPIESMPEDKGRELARILSAEHGFKFKGA